MIGEKIREVRQSQGRSLAEVAAKAKVSVATLSRVETDKQSVDVELLLVLARVLGIQAGDILGSVSDGNGNGGDPLAQRIAGLDAKKRTELWRELANERRAQRTRDRGASKQLGAQVEELLAQIDFLREEVESVRARLRKR